MNLSYNQNNCNHNSFSQEQKTNKKTKKNLAYVRVDLKPR